MAKKWVWHYQLTDRTMNTGFEMGGCPDVTGHIILPTTCGITAATEIMKQHAKLYFITFLNLLGEVDE